MKKILIGSIGLIFILVLVSFTSVANAQTIKINKMRTNDLSQYLREKTDNMNLIEWIKYIIGMVLFGICLGGLFFVHGIGLPGTFLDEIFFMIGIIAMLFLGMGGPF